LLQNFRGCSHWFEAYDRPIRQKESDSLLGCSQRNPRETKPKIRKKMYRSSVVNDLEFCI
jgi:hypothetical protein